MAESTEGAASSTSDGTGMVLYHSYPFRSTRCAWLLHELGVSEQVEFKRISLHGAQEAREQYRADVHPFGTLPALEITRGGEREVVLESGAICLFFADHFQQCLPPPEKTATYYNVRFM